MAERPKAVVLKTTERKLRGFESLSLRHLRLPNRCPFHAGIADHILQLTDPFSLTAPEHPAPRFAAILARNISAQ